MKNGLTLTLRITCFGLLSIFLLLVNVTTCAGTTKNGSLEITRVGLNKKSFNPSEGEKVVLSFETTKQADVQVYIYDCLGYEVRKFDMPEIETGRHSVTWDGRKEDGKLAAGNVFLYVIKAKTRDDRRATYNPSRRTGGFNVKTLEYTLDRDTGNIEYVLPKACMIRLRAGLEDGMLATTVFDWEPQVAGRHSYNWNGSDESGLMNILKHPELDLKLTCYTLPANTIIVTEEILPLVSGGKSIREISKKRARLWATDEKCRHYKHNPLICHEPKFEVLFPDKDKLSEKGVPIVSGVTKIRIELNPRDAQYLINKRFEIMVYVNGVFIFEVEEGSSPFTFRWDATGFKKGPNIITINVISYDDHIGVISKKVIIGERL